MEKEKKYTIDTLHKAWGAGYKKALSEKEDKKYILDHFLAYFDEIIYPHLESIRNDLKSLDDPIDSGLGFRPFSSEFILGFWAAREKWPKNINEKLGNLITLFEIKEAIEGKL